MKNLYNLTDKEKCEAFDRIRNRLEELTANDRYSLVNGNQLKDLLLPDGMWSFSQADG